MKTRKRNYFKSKLFVNLFLSYLVIIILFLVSFSGIIIYDALSTYHSKKNQEYHLKIEALANAMDLQVLSAKNIAASINNSETIRQMYTNVVVEKRSMDSFLLYQGLGELANTKTMSNGLDLFNIIVLFNGYNRAYTGSSVVLLKKDYTNTMSPVPYFGIDTASHVLGMKDMNEITFGKACIVYGDNYSYSSSLGNVNGTILVLFNEKSLTSKIKEIVGHYNGISLKYKGENVIQYGENKGVVFQDTSGVDNGLVYELYIDKADFKMGLDYSVYFAVGFIVITSIFFGFSAYMLSKKYYSPIHNLANIVQPTPSGKNEYEQIISGIQELIGERNGYREKMITISPYAKQGMLHGILNGNVEQDGLNILSDTSYLDLKKPYFELILANVDCQGDTTVRDIHYQDVMAIIQNVCSLASTEEVQILCYVKDNRNLFLILNSEEQDCLEDMVYQLHKSIVQEVDDEKFMITFGVSLVQDHMSHLKDAYMETKEALDNMFTGGRNAIYFYESSLVGDKREYYFPKDAQARVTKAFKDRNISELRKFLDEIYKNNMDKYDASPRTLRLLVDELHIVTLNALKTNNLFSTTQIQIDKMGNQVTLDEVFRYYDAIYETICKQMEELITPNSDIEELNKSIIAYMDENFKNPDLSLAHIGERFGVSNKYISLMCKNCLGVTYLQYIQDKRIEYATSLLETTELSLEQIANMIGYSNMLTFRRNFKSIMGMNPSDYRK